MMRGRTFMTILAGVIGLIVLALTVWFVRHLVVQLAWPEPLVH
jgi:hypothetical protein